MNRRKLLYVAPAIVTIAVLPQFASAGSVIVDPNAGGLCISDPKPRHGCKHYLMGIKRRALGKPVHTHN